MQIDELWLSYRRAVGRLTDQLEHALAERDEARRELTALQSAIKPARLGAEAAARLEADLEVYRLEERLIKAVLVRARTVVDLGEELAQITIDLEAAQAAAAKIGGGS